MRVRDGLVIGAGLAGPVAAMALAGRGIEVAVAEARPTRDDGEGAFLGVAPNGMHALDHLDLAGAVRAAGHPCAAFSFRNSQDREIGAIDRRRDVERFGWPLTMIRRGDLHRILADTAVARGIPVHRGRRLTGVEVRADGGTARFQDGSAMDAGLLLGCDGLRSTLRAQAFPDAPAPAFTGLLDHGGFAAPIEHGLPVGTQVMVFGERAFFGAFPLADGTTWWFHNGPPDGPEGTPRERLRELHRDDPAWIGELIDATPEVLGPWPLHELAGLRRWTRGPIALLGDAAHAMSPSAGQGASMAFEDAIALGRILAAGETLEAWERGRRPRVDAIFRAARRQGSGKAVRSATQRWFRDTMMPLFLRFGARAQDASYAHQEPW